MPPQSRKLEIRNSDRKAWLSIRFSNFDFRVPKVRCDMVAALVLATFVVFVLVDYFWQTRRPQPAVLASASEKLEEASTPLSMVGGFKVPAHLSYHPGHTWAVKEGRQVVRIGLDDFAARLVGRLDQIQLPARGRWLRQGERAWAVARGNHRFEMLSPIEGEVVDVNEEVLRDPSLAHRDPYGAGWFLTVNAPAVDANMKNLLRGRLAHHWMEESVAALRTWASPVAPIGLGSGPRAEVEGPARDVHLQDGGHAVADMLSVVPEERWERVIREAFLA
jgi:glycine cleavage system H lipoate-binding protein